MKMLGIEELKEHIEVTKGKVECPVRGCEKKVARQRGRFKKSGRFKCPEHNIYISPSTFEYEYDTDNLLWHGAEDLRLLNRLRAAKLASGMARDNSEDAVTWNVFRYLDKENLVVPVMERLIGVTLEEPEVIYWTYRGAEDADWSEFDRAREEFGEHARGAGPDVIINSKNALLFIEAKLITGNETKPRKAKATEKLLEGGQHWFPRVFTSNYHTVAVKDKRYELMRFWLLGTWMAARRGIDFCLLNLVCEGREEDIETVFGRHISQSPARVFKRITWEDIYRRVLECEEMSSGKDKMIRYFENKTAGYGRKGKLLRAFQV